MSDNAKAIQPDTEKLTWREFCERVEAAGVKDSDTIDSIDVGWEAKNNLVCEMDIDFGWQIRL